MLTTAEVGGLPRPLARHWGRREGGGRQAAPPKELLQSGSMKTQGERRDLLEASSCAQGRDTPASDPFSQDLTPSPERPQLKI